MDKLSSCPACQGSKWERPGVPCSFCRAAPSSSADELPPLPVLPQHLIGVIGEYGMARTDGLGDTDRINLWTQLAEEIKVYATDYARSAIAADRRARQGEPVARTHMTDEQAERWAWEQVKEQVGTEGWTTGDSCNYFGFFLWGWRYRAQYERQRAAIQAAAPADAPTPVAWALVSPKGGIKKLAIQRQSVESRMARWLEEWPGNTPRIRPLVYGDVGAPAEDAREQQPAGVKVEGKEG